ncbi:MAG: hypothetical protein RIB41_12250 [Oceanibaculum nanhaiense]|jgi:hypothetical protein|uniref:hypothetical protein n=1 Tax=Oceanibaculum nanhaiense TaxID=1909734 RepID=UPI0032ED72D4
MNIDEKALAHTIGNKVEVAYRRGDLFDRRRQMMRDFAAYCGGSGGYAAAADTADTAVAGARYLMLAVDNETDEGDGILYNAPFTTRRRKAA